MLYNRRVDRLLIIFVPAVLFVYFSTRPHVRLRAEMPPDFVDVPESADSGRREKEARLAQQYWDCALNVIQWKFTYGSPLPDVPPDDFRVSKSSAESLEPASGSRARYWGRLQKAWLQPESWTMSRQWNTDWLTNPIRDGWRWTEGYFRDLLTRS